MPCGEMLWDHLNKQECPALSWLRAQVLPGAAVERVQPHGPRRGHHAQHLLSPLLAEVSASSKKFSRPMWGMGHPPHGRPAHTHRSRWCRPPRVPPCHCRAGMGLRGERGESAGAASGRAVHTRAHRPALSVAPHTGPHPAGVQTPAAVSSPCLRGLGVQAGG